MERNVPLPQSLGSCWLLLWPLLLPVGNGLGHGVQENGEGGRPMQNSTLSLWVLGVSCYSARAKGLPLEFSLHTFQCPRLGFGLHCIQASRYQSNKNGKLTFSSSSLLHSACHCLLCSFLPGALCILSRLCNCIQRDSHKGQYGRSSVRVGRCDKVRSEGKQ